jgi:hypothetical protein
MVGVQTETTFARHYAAPRMAPARLDVRVFVEQPDGTATHVVGCVAEGLGLTMLARLFLFRA